MPVGRELASLLAFDTSMSPSMGVRAHHERRDYSLFELFTLPRVSVHVQALHRKQAEVQDQLHSCNATLAQTKRDKEELANHLQERSLQLAELQREAADKKRALDSECEKLSRERHKRQRIEEDNKVRIASQRSIAST